MKKKLLTLLIIIIVFLIAVFFINYKGKQSDSAKDEEITLGTPKDPVKMYFVPSMEAGKVVTSAESIASRLESLTGYKFKVAVPTSYAAVIEAMGTEQADIGWLPTFAYILAKEKYNAEIALTTIRNELSFYRGQFIASYGSNIKTLEDISGKTIAYTDASSTSGYIYPSALLSQKNIKPAQYYFAGGHPQAVLAVYQGRADVACTYWSPPKDGEPQDARKAVVDTYPDVMDKVKPFAFTDWIPNDTVTFRADFPPEIKAKITQALLDYAQTPEGKATLYELYSVDGFKTASDEDYDVVRSALSALGISAEELINE